MGQLEHSGQSDETTQPAAVSQSPVQSSIDVPVAPTEPIAAETSDKIAVQSEESEPAELAEPADQVLNPPIEDNAAPEAAEPPQALVQAEAPFAPGSAPESALKRADATGHRMLIREIEVDNFKSFQGKATIPFFGGFTTVSGPNGSGKSNIIDGILFCLGLSTSRTLRAEKLTDLINHHTKRGDAQVKISFETTDPAMPQLTVARRVKSSKAGYSSTYYLNDHVATLGEVHERLAQYRVSPGCYNVMMQGDVAGIVNMSAGERRKIIDELAGIAEFDRKIDQANQELGTTQQNIERTEILRAEIADRLKQLADERDKALKYQSLKAQQKTAEAQLDWIKLRDLQRAEVTTQETLALGKTQQQQLKQESRGLLKQMEGTRAQLLALSEEIKRKGEDEQIAVQRQIESLKGHIARKIDTIRLAEEQIAGNLQTLTQIQADEARLADAIANIDAAVGQLNHQRSELEQQYEAEELNYQNKLKGLEGFSQQQSPQTQQLAELRKAVQLATDELAELNRQKLDFEAQLKRLQETYTHQQRLMGTQAEQGAMLEKRQQQLAAEQTLLRKAQDADDAELNEQQLALTRLKEQLNALRQDYQTAQQELAKQQARKAALEDAGVFSRAVETLLDEGLGGVHGTLGQLITFDADNAIALETALGGRIQNVVVDDDAVGQRCIEFLKQKRAGRATFLPLSKLQRARSLPVCPNSAGVVDFAQNLVDFDGIYEDAVAYALGDTLVVDSLANGRRLLGKFRIVTQDGELLEKSGAMTGGQNANSGQNSIAKIMLQKQQLDDAIQKQLRTVQALQKEGESAAKKVQTLEPAIEALRTRLNDHHARLAAIHAELTTLTDQAPPKPIAQDAVIAPADFEAQHSKLQWQVDALVRLLQKKAGALDAQHAQMAQLEAEVESGPGEQLEALRKAVTEAKFQADYIDTQRRNIDSELKAKGIERHYHTVGLKEHADRREKLLAQNVQLAKDKANAQEEIQVSQQQQQALEAKIAQLSESFKQLQTERDGVQAQLMAQENQKAQFERDVARLLEQQAAFEARLRELAPEIEALKASLLERGEQPPETLEQLPDVEAIQTTLASLSRRLQALEPVNMLAVDAYAEAETRASSLTDKVGTLQREVEALGIKISSYEELKRVHFIKSFDLVNTQFKTIFAELSDGYGQLVLTDPENPLAGGLTIEAQPRGKKTQRLESMSGGEKSLTSLAFVFALQRAMPAPFYALDEVDMNLDGMNVEKLAKLIQREARGAQFIVVSLRKPMLEHSDRTVGVTQKPGGMTKITGIAWSQETVNAAKTSASAKDAPDTPKTLSA
ncbi:MAG: chromosome segregation protein SMC [Vampirovibrionales bacterium]|nr:chromosome segregation protein SMC [Vampirovibrionales bacterium]